MKTSSLLFFSGGTALKETAVSLATYRVPSTHIITTFDSGGSSAVLRHAFGLPAVGDIRARLLALADTSSASSIHVNFLLGQRLEKTTSFAAQQELIALIKGEHPFTKENTSRIAAIREQLYAFYRKMPCNFDLSSASIGNLVLAGAYLDNGRNLKEAVRFFASLVHAAGKVHAVSTMPAHLAVRLANGNIISGQHRFSGKECPVVTSPIIDVWLCRAEDDASCVSVSAADHVLEKIAKASCICFPFGSFYSSIMAHLLVDGVATAVGKADCPKVFIPNPGHDPETFGCTVQEQVARLLFFSGGKNRVNLTHVLIDKRAKYFGGIPYEFFNAHEVTIIEANLLEKETKNVFNGQQVAHALCCFL